jgi:hypothetical protein
MSRRGDRIARSLVEILHRTSPLLRATILRSPYASTEEKDRMYRSFRQFLEQFAKLIDRSEGRVEWTKTELSSLRSSQKKPE